MTLPPSPPAAPNALPRASIDQILAEIRFDANGLVAAIALAPALIAEGLRRAGLTWVA